MAKGIYATTYGNTCFWDGRSKSAWDLDMAERIPVKAVAKNQFIRKATADTMCLINAQKRTGSTF